MKKTISLLLVICICFSLCFMLFSCDESSTPNKDVPSTSTDNNNKMENNTDNNSNSNNNNSNNNQAQGNTDDNTEDTSNSNPTIPETPKEKKSYLITYSAKLIQNASVGDSWSYGVKYDSEEIDSGTKITAELTEGPSFILYAIEYDKSSNDYGSLSIEFSDLAIGEEETKTEIVDVRENDGRYSGNHAKWEFTITCKRISKGSDGNANTPTFTGSLCIDIDYETGMPLYEVTEFERGDYIAVAGMLSGVTGENNLTIRWTFPDGSTEDISQYYILNNETINTGFYCSDLGVGDGTVSVILDSTQEILATYCYTITDGCLLYTEVDLPITLSTTDGEITINTITYYYEIDESASACDLFFTIYSDKSFENDFSLEYLLYNEHGDLFECIETVDEYGEDLYEGNCIFSIEIKGIPIADYTISFGDYSLGDTNFSDFVDDCLLFTEIDLPIIINASSGNIFVNNIEYQFDSADTGTCTIWIGFDLVSDTYIENFSLNFSLIGETTGTVQEYCIEEINVYGSDGNYISFFSGYYDIPTLPIDSYTIVFE